MDNLSKLLQEAKPLYFKRKRIRNRIKAGLCMLIGIAVIGLYQPASITYEDNGEWVNYEQYMSNTSPIEELGLLVDEYGLLMVS